MLFSNSFAVIKSVNRLFYFAGNNNRVYLRYEDDYKQDRERDEDFRRHVRVRGVRPGESIGQF